MKGIGLGDEEGDSKLQDMLGSLTFETNFFKRLQALEVIFNMIDIEVAKAVGLYAFKSFLLAYTDDNKFLRQAKMISIIEENVETALEYYGMDYISTPEFNFDVNFQKERRKIDKKINSFIGLTLKELNQEEDFFD